MTYFLLGIAIIGEFLLNQNFRNSPKLKIRRDKIQIRGEKRKWEILIDFTVLAARQRMELHKKAKLLFAMLSNYK